MNLGAIFGLPVRLALRSLRRWRMIWRAYLLHGIVLPSGATMAEPGGVRIGQGFGISEQCHLCCQDPENGSELWIGDNVKLNIGVNLNADCGGKIRIGNDVLFGPYVVVRAAGHRFDRTDVPIRDQGHSAGSIVIEDDVWLGAHVVVLPGVRIGKGAVIAAGSVVTRDVPAWSVAAGVPASELRKRAD